ncbi:MAG: glycoside hydrolase family 13 protein [Chitinophagaceae bacterium]
MKRVIIVSAFLIIAQFSFAQDTPEVYPSNWWTGMKWSNLQLMIHYKNVGNIVPTYKLPAAGSKIADGIILKMVHHVESPNYIFLDVVIDKNAKPGTRTLSFGRPGNELKFTYELKARRPGNGTAFAQGVTSSDLVYLLMPDRFSNGDPSNDRIAGMRDQTLNRDSNYHRHGGDFQGVINHLDYLKDLGVSTVWMTPVIENDMPHRTEHGYAFTNHYTIEPRFGGPAMYKKLSAELHARGMKLIQDAVYNHIGSYHFTVIDPPMKDWLHQWPSYTQTNYRDQALFDPYASNYDKKKLTDGWFTREMPDINQNNPYAANYMIQHAIWSVEEFGVDGWRIDTYIYNDLDFMNRCNKALTDEYPKITMFGETWVHGVANQSYFCQNNDNVPFKSNLQATTDFQQLFYGIQAALTEQFGWTDGLSKLYTTTSQDFLYKNPMREVIFMDNHDLSRFYSVLKEDLAKYKMALGWLMTFRGVPQLYYGDEILMTGLTSPNDGWVRLDFKGGWAGDSVNKFTAAGRTDRENEAFNYLKTLANFRKNSSAIKTGKLMQFIPEEGAYVYFRYDDKQTIMCIMNTNDDEKTIKLERFAERMTGFSKATNISTGSTSDLGKTMSIEGKKMLVLELAK